VTERVRRRRSCLRDSSWGKPSLNFSPGIFVRRHFGPWHAGDRGHGDQRGPGFCSLLGIGPTPRQPNPRQVPARSWKRRTLPKGILHTTAPVPDPTVPSAAGVENGKRTWARSISPAGASLD
jgi:hypothetical protein